MSHTAPPPECRGFSLVELLMVLTIAATLATIAMPRYSASLDRYRAEFAARRIAADLDVARSRARVLSIDQTVSFALHPGANQYQILGMPDPDHPSSIYTVRLGDAPYRARIVAVDLGNDQTVIYNGYGLPDTGGTITVVSGAHEAVVQITSPLDAAIVE